MHVVSQRDKIGKGKHKRKTQNIRDQEYSSLASVQFIEMVSLDHTSRKFEGH